LRTVIFDIESFGLSPDMGLPLCLVGREFGRPREEVKIIRIDEMGPWKAGHRSDTSQFAAECVDYLKQFDILVAHNGKKFDRPYILTLAVKHKLDLGLHRKKIIDPVWLSRYKLRMVSNGLNALLKFFDVEDEKTSINWSWWRQAAFDDDKESWDHIITHCVQDVHALYGLYDRFRDLVNNIDNRGSSS
jgi:uncharacterized protein YprB with RNaseH-like and TPR domain